MALSSPRTPVKQLYSLSSPVLPLREGDFTSNIIHMTTSNQIVH